MLDQTVFVTRFEDVKYEIDRTVRGKYDLYVTDSMTKLCSHLGTFKTEQAARYTIRQIIGEN